METPAQPEAHRTFAKRQRRMSHAVAKDSLVKEKTQPEEDNSIEEIVNVAAVAPLDAPVEPSVPKHMVAYFTMIDKEVLLVEEEEDDKITKLVNSQSRTSITTSGAVLELQTSSKKKK